LAGPAGRQGQRQSPSVDGRALRARIRARPRRSTLEQDRQFTQATLGLAPLVMPSRLGSLAEAFGSEAAWQAHATQDASLLESLLGCEVDDVEPSPFVAGLRPDLALSVGGREVVVELQLAGADPRHLGQVVRYQRHTGADLVLWLAEDARGYAAHVDDL